MRALLSMPDTIAAPPPCPGSFRPSSEIAANPRCRRCGKCSVIALALGVEQGAGVETPRLAKKDAA